MMRDLRPCSACCRVELRTQEAERGMNSEEAEKLVWAAQTIFATGCKLRLPAVSQLDHLPMLHYACRCESLLAVHVLRYHRSCVSTSIDNCLGARSGEVIHLHIPSSSAADLEPLMKALAYLFPDKGIRSVSSPDSARCPLTGPKIGPTFPSETASDMLSSWQCLDKKETDDAALYAGHSGAPGAQRDSGRAGEGDKEGGG